VLMPNHFHLLVSPRVTLERAIQCIKGGFSYRAKRELGFGGEVWEHSFYDRRVRNLQEYQRIRQYIHQNPVRRALAALAEQFPYSSACGAIALDEVPQRLKPPCVAAL
jgi:putative transposase